MTWNYCKKCIKADLLRLTNKITIRNFIKYSLFNASFKMTFWFRIGSYLKTKRNIFFKILYSFVFFIHKRNQYKTGIQISFGTKVGEGLTFSHFSCIVINYTSIIGKNCTIFQGVTIGSKRGEKGGAPIIGNNVVLSANSSIIGPIRIGDNSIIGAGSVVVCDIPGNSVAVGASKNYC